MEADNINPNNKEVNWRHFPDIYQLSQYLIQSDLIQLSLACSQFRNKLNLVIFRKLELLKRGEVIPGKPNISSKRKQLEILLHVLEEDYSEKYSFVQHCIIWEPCNNSFFIKLFSTLKYITKLELYSNSDSISRSSLVRILEPLKKLEILIFDCKFIDSLEVEDAPNFKLPTCLKVLNVKGNTSNRLNFDQIEVINGEYTELKKVTIINNSMLANISGSIKSLTEVDLFNNQYFCSKYLVQLFSSNPQLNKVSISLKFVESDVINSILSLKKLYKLSIAKYSDENNNELNILTISKSIKHLYIGSDITQNILLPILSGIKSLHTLEFSGYDFWNFNTINWSSYNGKISLFHLNCVYCTDYNLDILLNSSIFGKIRFSNNFELDYYIKYCNFGSLENWMVVQDDPLSEYEFSLVRKHEEKTDS